MKVYEDISNVLNKSSRLPSLSPFPPFHPHPLAPPPAPPLRASVSPPTPRSLSLSPSIPVSPTLPLSPPSSPPLPPRLALLSLQSLSHYPFIMKSYCCIVVH